MKDSLEVWGVHTLWKDEVFFQEILWDYFQGNPGCLSTFSKAHAPKGGKRIFF